MYSAVDRSLFPGSQGFINGQRGQVPSLKSRISLQKKEANYRSHYTSHVTLQTWLNLPLGISFLSCNMRILSPTSQIKWDNACKVPSEHSVNVIRYNRRRNHDIQLESTSLPRWGHLTCQQHKTMIKTLSHPLKHKDDTLLPVSLSTFISFLSPHFVIC